MGTCTRIFLKRIEEVESRDSRKNSQHIKIDGHSITFFGENKVVYTPLPTLEKLHSSDSMVRLIKGPYGSGKTVGCLMEIILRACSVPPLYNGIRVSKWLIVRNTYAQLISTTLATWMNWCRYLGDCRQVNSPLVKCTHKFNDGKGDVELELHFLSLDRPEDIVKVKSLEVSGIYLNEASELEGALLTHLLGRRRFPPDGLIKDGQSYWRGIIADTNPPDYDHWIYKIFIESIPQDYEIYQQPSGVIKIEKENIPESIKYAVSGKGDYYVTNPEAENIKNLSKNYYIDMIQGAPEEYVRVYAMGDWGTLRTGKVVYQEYNDDIHSSDLKPDESIPLIIGMDYGLTPAAVICQVNERGKLSILKEITTDRVDITSFVHDILIPTLNINYNGLMVSSIECDPASLKANEINLLSSISVLYKAGLPATTAVTNNIEQRISSVKYFLNKLLDGKPGFIIDRKSCPMLRKGFIDKYHYRRMMIVGQEKYKDIPDKNEYSHVHDALQYVCLRVYNNIGICDNKKVSKDVFNPVRWANSYGIS